MLVLPDEVAWNVYGTYTSERVQNGTPIRVEQRRVKVIWSVKIICMRISVHGMQGHAAMPPAKAIWNVSSTYMRMGVLGTSGHIAQ